MSTKEITKKIQAGVGVSAAIDDARTTAAAATPNHG